MDKKYRGWHYHVEHPDLSQIELMQRLEAYLSTRHLRSSDSDPWLAVGFIEQKPAKYSLWLNAEGNRTLVLWISAVTGSLHIESNKVATFTKSILSKGDLVQILKGWCELEKSQSASITKSLSEE